jgi:deoxyribonuclease-4
MNSAERHAKMNSTGLRVGRHYGPGGKYLLESLVQVLDEPASAMQLFPGNPHRYWASKPADEHREAFLEKSSHLYKVAHANYLTNIAANPSTERGYRMTINSLINNLEWAERHGCDSLVFHPGSPKDYDFADAMQWSEEALREVLTRYEGPVELLMENAAHKKKIGGIVEDTILPLFNAIDDSRLGICIDTTHAYHAGYDIDPMVEMLTNLTTLGALRLVHFNTPDAGCGLGCQRDRHSSTFDQGEFTLAQIQTLFQAAKHLPMILEGTPDLGADLVWLLRWESEFRDTGAMTPPVPGHKQLGELFELTDNVDAGQIP